MSFTVYILQSQITERYYCGQTDDIMQRLNRHNSAEVKSTKHGVPWKLIATVNCDTRAESMKLESTIKKRGIKRWLEEHPDSLKR
jgi:putative endonuclease